MKTTPLFLYVIVVSFLVFQSCKDSSTNSGNQYPIDISELENYLHPLNSTSPTSSLDDLSPIHNFGNAKVVGLGEATHGTSEFFQMKHKIFRYLVENHGVRVFAIEADMGESVYVDRYIQGYGNDLTDIMKNKMIFWIWRTEEVRDLIEWMRIYNEGKPESERLHYIGIDSQYFTHQPSLIENYLSQVSPSLLEKITGSLTVIRDLGEHGGIVLQSYKSMSPEQYESIDDTLSYLTNKLNEHKSELIAGSSHFDFHTYIRLAENLKQVHEHNYSKEKQQISQRDRFMSDNILWLTTLLGEDIKAAIWAHNYHVGKGNKSLGKYLSNDLAGQYKAIGFSFSRGSFRARTYELNNLTEAKTNNIYVTPAVQSINGIFHAAEYDQFILNFDYVPNDSEIGKFFLSPREFLSIGASYTGNPIYYYSPTPLKSYFDAIIHIDETTAAKPLNGSE